MTEASFWDSLRAAIKKTPDAVAWKVEDAFRKGLPDVVWRVESAAGFMELKYLEKFPARPSTKVRVKVTPNQMRHLLEWKGRHGFAYLLVGVGREWFLFQPEVVNGWPKAGEDPAVPEAEFRKAALAKGVTADWSPLLFLLKRSGAFIR